jgi:hypothetical protein
MMCVQLPPGAGGGGGGGGGFIKPLPPPGSLESQAPNQLADTTHHSIEEHPWFKDKGMSLSDAISGKFNPMDGTENAEPDR